MGGGDFEGDRRWLPRCAARDPGSGVRCALDEGHWKDHKAPIVVPGKRVADRDAIIREWRDGEEQRIG